MTFAEAATGDFVARSIISRLAAELAGMANPSSAASIWQVYPSRLCWPAACFEREMNASTLSSSTPYTQ